MTDDDFAWDLLGGPAMTLPLKQHRQNEELPVTMPSE